MQCVCMEPDTSLYKLQQCRNPAPAQGGAVPQPPCRSQRRVAVSQSHIAGILRKNLLHPRAAQAHAVSKTGEIS